MTNPTPHLQLVATPTKVAPWHWRRLPHLPPEDFEPVYLLQLAGGQLTLGHRMTTHRNARTGGSVARSVVPGAVETTYFVDAAGNAVPDVKAWCLVEPMR